jgi:formate--tetrahydrofolate ligase
MRQIHDVAADLGLHADDLVPCGRNVLKVELGALERPAQGAGRLILVSAITPTRSGEGKTLTSIGLAMGLSRIGRRSAVCLREPSLGPVFGIKGGGTGGGRSRVQPADAIDLHFTGDLHAVTSAHNLLAALIDNDLHFRQSELDPRRVTWRRVLDVNDRALRDVITGLGERAAGVPRQTGFDITAASEVLAVQGLAKTIDDLRERLAAIVVGRDEAQRFVTAGSLGAGGAMALLLRDALLPNLVQTSEGTPAFVHGGAFANVAHGCSSLLATRLACHVADEVVTEAGFAFELGGEKFLQIKCRKAGLWPRCVVLVVTAKALVEHGGGEARPDPAALTRGFANLDHHIANVRRFGLEPVVAVNVFADDSDDELAAIEAHCNSRGVRAARHTAYAEGGAGAEALARAVTETIGAQATPPQPRFLYELEDSYEEKLRILATQLYGAKDIVIERLAKRQLRRFSRAGYGNLPVCVAKTPFSLGEGTAVPIPSPDSKIHVTEARLSAGAGFVVALTGRTVTMPGLPKKPSAREISVESDGSASGLGE